MKTIDEKAEEYADRNDLIIEDGEYTDRTIINAYLAGYEEAQKWIDPKDDLPEVDKIKYPNGNYSDDVLGEDFEGNSIIIYYNHDEKKWYFTMDGEDYTVHITKWRPI